MEYAHTLGDIPQTWGKSRKADTYRQTLPKTYLGEIAGHCLGLHAVAQITVWRGMEG
jgi:hypothetical protein